MGVVRWEAFDRPGCSRASISDQPSSKAMEITKCVKVKRSESFANPPSGIVSLTGRGSCGWPVGCAAARPGCVRTAPAGAPPRRGRACGARSDPSAGRPPEATARGTWTARLACTAQTRPARLGCEAPLRSKHTDTHTHRMAIVRACHIKKLVGSSPKF